MSRNIGKMQIDDSIICSVVPRATVVLAKDLKKISGRRPYIIGKDIKVPLRNKYRFPKQVGQDRLVNAYAAVKLFGAPLIAVDFGTAITFDVVSKKEEYLGGMIIPGLNLSLHALFEQTALLPKVSLGRPKEFIGRDTESSMLSGVIHGYAALTDTLTERIKARIGNHATVVGTGGNINLIAGYCRNFNRIDRDLTLKGLALIFKNKKNS
jgi:type III pantothenate kinase